MPSALAGGGSLFVCASVLTPERRVYPFQICKRLHIPTSLQLGNALVVCHSYSVSRGLEWSVPHSTGLFHAAVRQNATF